MAPQNESPWNYLRGVLRRLERPLADVEGFAAQFAGDLLGMGKGRSGDGDNDDVKGGIPARSGHALDVLAEIYAEQAMQSQRDDAAEEEARQKREMADRALRLLETRYDVIRAGYWAYRRRELWKGDGGAAAAAAAAGVVDDTASNGAAAARGKGVK